MTASAKTVFFLTLEERNIFLTDKQHDFLTNTLKLYENQNYLVTTHYLRLILKETTKFLDHELESLEKYLTSFGVSDFMDGIYRLFYKRDEVKTMEIFNKTKDFYHLVMRDMALKEIEDAKNNFPIMTVDLEEKCFFPSEEKKIKIRSNEYIDKLNLVNVTDGIFLNLDDKLVKVECCLDKKEKFCVTKEKVEIDGNYSLIVPERIQRKDCAFKVNEGTSKSQVYVTEIKVNETETKNNYEIDFGENADGIIITIIFSSKPDKNVFVTNNNKRLNCQLNETKMECKITKDDLPFDEVKPNEFKKYTLKLIDLCSEEKYSFTVNVKNSKAEPKKTEGGGIPTVLIVLICIGGVIILVVIAFFVYRAIRRKGDKGDTDEPERGASLLEDN